MARYPSISSNCINFVLLMVLHAIGQTAASCQETAGMIGELNSNRLSLEDDIIKLKGWLQRNRKVINDDKRKFQSLKHSILSKQHKVNKLKAQLNQLNQQFAALTTSKPAPFQCSSGQHNDANIGQCKLHDEVKAYLAAKNAFIEKSNALNANIASVNATLRGAEAEVNQIEQRYDLMGVQVQNRVEKWSDFNKLRKKKEAALADVNQQLQALAAQSEQKQDEQKLDIAAVDAESENATEKNSKRIHSMRNVKSQDDWFVVHFETLDPTVAKSIDLFRNKVNSFKRGCETEQSADTLALVALTLSSARCAKDVGVTILAPEKLIPGTSAVISCSGTALLLYAKGKTGDNLSQCNELERLRNDYQTHCEGKSLLVFVDRERLYCYSIAGNNDGLKLLEIDFKTRTARVKTTSK